MILYLDTSSLVKLYVQEAGSDDVGQAVAAATVVATSVLAYAEARAAFGRLRREGVLSASDLRRVRAALDRDWSGYWVLPVDERLTRAAGSLAEKHALRGFDSLHLASFAHLLHELGPELVSFSSFYKALNRAASLEARRRGTRLRRRVP